MEGADLRTHNPLFDVLVSIGPTSSSEFNLTQHQEAKHQKAAPTVRASHGAFYCCELSPRRTSFGATLMATSEQPSPC
ncbi:hypothetical protein HYQ45_002597 [Verticillium longisporum]|uniref:Uncharacterized protein n=1 Tax=Verticillium longisporum TaxID=100787 RepID=A0A8I3AV84_VERLO|nr:hypothetical protein HYQ45_002597 [Verticillium longisporum]